MNQIACRTLLLSCLMMFFSLEVCAQEKPMTMDQSVALISSTRTKIEQRVKKIKLKFAPDATQYKQAEDLYENVESQAQGFSDAITLAVRQGRKPEGLDSTAESFTREAKIFVDFCNEALNMPKSGAGLPVVAIMGFAKSFWSMFKSAKQEKRDAKAAQIATMLKFKDWDSIK